MIRSGGEIACLLCCSHLLLFFFIIIILSGGGEERSCSHRVGWAGLTSVDKRCQTQIKFCFVCFFYLNLNEGPFFLWFSRLFFFLSFFRKLYCAVDVPFTRYMKLQSLWSLVVSAGEWSHFLYSKMKMLLNSFGFCFFCFLRGGRTSTWSWSLFSLLPVETRFVYIHEFLSYDVQLCGTLAAWRRSCFVFHPTPPSLPPPRCATGRFCSTETRKIQRCLFLKEKRGVSSCSISFPCIYVFLSRGSLILMLMKNMLWNEHICRD